MKKRYVKLEDSDGNIFDFELLDLKNLSYGKDDQGEYKIDSFKVVVQDEDGNIFTLYDPKIIYFFDK